jgi:hypothetical protein
MKAQNIQINEAVARIQDFLRGAPFCAPDGLTLGTSQLLILNRTDGIERRAPVSRGVGPAK